MGEDRVVRSAGRWRLWAAAALTAAALTAMAGLLAVATLRALHARDQAERQTALEADALAREAGRSLAAAAKARIEQIRVRDDQAHLEAAAAVEVLRVRVEELFRAPPPAPPARKGAPLPAALAFLRDIADALAEDNVLAGDWPAERLRSTLRAEPPAGCAFAVYEEFSKPLLQVGAAGGANTVSASREFAFFDGKRHRFWTLTAEVGVSDQPAALTAREAAASLAALAGGGALAGADQWQGFLYDADGKVAAAFPVREPAPLMPLAVAAGTGGELPSSVPVAGPPLADWRPLGATADGTPTIARVLRAGASLPAEWSVGVAVAMRRPAALAAAAAEIERDPRWGAALAIALFFALAAGFRLIRLALAARRAAPAPTADASVRESSSVAAPSTLPPSVAAPATAWQDRQPVAGSSLRRLQTLHRGSTGLGGSRVLDQARSPLLRELAQRLRPGDAARATRAKGGKTTAARTAAATAVLDAPADRQAAPAPEPPSPPPAQMTNEEIVGELMRRQR